VAAQTTQTNQQIITEAFINLGVVASGRAPTSTQTATALTVLNDNMLTQMRDGWHDIGWYPQLQSQLNTAAPLLDQDVADVKLILSAWLAPKFGRKIEPSPVPDDPTTLFGQISAAFRRLNKRYLRQTEADLGELSRPQGGPWGGPNWL
jgi:hypothetical protein